MNDNFNRTQNDISDISIYESLQNINQTLIKQDKELIDIKKSIQKLETLIQDSNTTMESEIVGECKKMGRHIDFIENIYENVKYPLGYVCNNINSFIGSSKNQYTLDNVEDNGEDNVEDNDEDNSMFF